DLGLVFDRSLGGKKLRHLESLFHVDSGQIVRGPVGYLHAGHRTKQQRASSHVHEHFAEGTDAFHRTPGIFVLRNLLGQRQGLARAQVKGAQDLLTQGGQRRRRRRRTGGFLLGGCEQGGGDDQECE